MHTFRNLTLCLAFAAGSATIVSGAPFAFEDADLLLGIQAGAGTGANRNIFFNLGKTTAFLSDGNRGELGNISTELEETFGNDWYLREDLWFGVIGNRSNLSPTLDPGEPGEEPGRTFYVSRSTDEPGAAAARPAIGNTGLGNGATKYAGMKGLFLSPTTGETLEATPSGAAILIQNAHPVGWNNSWSQWNPLPGAAFDIFSGGIQNNFGKEADSVMVDVQRMVPGSAGAYVVTIAVGSDGTITAMGPGGGGESVFSEWIAEFNAQIPNLADREPDADPDDDGYTNLQEFAFGGSPVSGNDTGRRFSRTADATGNGQGDLALTIEVRAGAAFGTSGTAMVATRDGVIYRIEGSQDLQSYNSPVSEVTPHLGTGSPKAGYEFKTFRLNASGGLAGRGFLRAGVLAQ